jgi:phospholipid transport system substrate-binding protein
MLEQEESVMDKTRWRGRTVAVVIAVLVAIVISARATALPASPQDSVRDFYATLLTTMKDGHRLGESGRYARLVPAVGALFDVPLMARLAVGPFWPTLSPVEQQRVTAAFAHYISATYADRFDSYSGQQFEVAGERPSGAGTIVHTRIVKATGASVTIDYLMRESSGSWQIADVYLDGTISQLATQRSEFYSLLRRDGVAGLIAALNRKVDLLTRSPA